MVEVRELNQRRMNRSVSSQIPSLPTLFHKSLARRIVAAFVVVVMVAFGPLFSGAEPSLAQDSGATPPSLIGGDSDAPCADGVLRVRDLENADESIAAGMAAAADQAKAWRQDARLYTLNLSCPLLEPGYRWNGVFFSEAGQAYYRTDTYEVFAAEEDPATIPTLDPGVVSFQDVYRSLIRAGFDGNLTIDASGGVIVRESTDSAPFGPSNAPRGRVYVHLAISDRNDIKDIWIDVVDGTIYRYEV